MLYFVFCFVINRYGLKFFYTRKATRSDLMFELRQLSMGVYYKPLTGTIVTSAETQARVGIVLITFCKLHKRP